ncbi:MAG TPA: hypothetical protein VLM79_25175 [Kofleriaceae bacterium]|nr:hypothetical protein [Kofleriaceae bacterium]
MSGPLDSPQTQVETQAVSEELAAPRAASSPATTNETETCTTTPGPCKVGRCELGANDTVQILTEVCCTPSGGCETERYRLCGC